MKVIALQIDGARLIEPRVFEDERGSFFEAWNARAFAAHGLDAAFVQDNHSRSGRHVLRGLHFQATRPQGKLIRVARGRAFTVLVDLRRASPTFGQWLGLELSATPALMLWAPPGLAHGFLALEDDTDYLYKCTDFYEPGDERVLLWNDPDIGIAWPVASPILNARDRAGTRFKDLKALP